MASFARPKLIVLDTSQFAAIVRDWSSTDRARRQSVSRFHDMLAERDAVPLLSLHHLIELVTHNNAATVANRLNYLRSLPRVAWFRPEGDVAGIGSIASQLAAELAAVEMFPDALLDEIRAYVLASSISYGSGRDAIGP